MKKSLTFCLFRVYCFFIGSKDVSYVYFATSFLFSFKVSFILGNVYLFLLYLFNKYVFFLSFFLEGKVGEKQPDEVC